MLRTVLLAALILPLAAAGCGTPRQTAVAGDDTPTAPPAEPPALDTPFTLARGESAEIDGFRTTFVAVLEDSRCPANVTCVWEGRASVNLTLAEGGRTGGVNLELPGTTGVEDTGRHRTVEALGHRITLMALDPYPGTEEAESGAAPRVTLLVRRAGD
jgi:hypothetical protein